MSTSWSCAVFLYLYLKLHQRNISIKYMLEIGKLVSEKKSEYFDIIDTCIRKTGQNRLPTEKSQLQEISKDSYIPQLLPKLRIDKIVKSYILPTTWLDMAATYVLHIVDNIGLKFYKKIIDEV